FRELAASRPLSELRTAEEGTAAAKAEVESVNHENEREVNPNIIEAEELENYSSVCQKIHLFAARFKDRCGDIAGARESYQLLEAIIRYANIEYHDACSLYESTIAIEKGKEQSQISPILCAQYSRFLYMVLGRVKEATKVLSEALENNQLPKPLLEALIHIESIQSLPKQVNHLDSLVDKFISPGPDNSSAACFIEREEISSIGLEFLDLFGDAQSIKKSNVRHLKLFLHQKSYSESKKRHQESYSASERKKLRKMAHKTIARQVMVSRNKPHKHKDNNGPWAIIKRVLMAHIMLMEVAMPIHKSRHLSHKRLHTLHNLLLTIFRLFYSKFTLSQL
nr:pre-mRNA-processing factor 39-like isoform X1 [Tanacetum cinerariifolium]